MGRSRSAKRKSRRPSRPSPAARVRSNPCTGQGALRLANVHLPVLKGNTGITTIRKSRSGKRRAIVLATVQLLMIAHIIQWLLTGRTLTPVEPSESVQTLRDGIINTGAIFFGLALLSTLILGRWFCGWGCHIVMLQDLCGWIMKKLGIRPKAFRSRLLIYVPLAMALYMFVWPVFYRVAIAPWTAPAMQSPGFRAEFTTAHFWETFPPLLVAVPFLLICGFGAVYFLGAKGYCTYGCPYGGFFAPLDKLAVGSIRVTDACEQCGHCTAVCTSNVRVHEEVREYGMVVDPGCMKCLDCVSVCPNDALYFGFGAPTILKGPAKQRAPKRVYDVTVRGDLALLLVFVVAFFSVLGVYSRVPYLMASGMASVVTWLAWKGGRMLRDANVNLHRFRLKSGGSWTAAGRVFATVTVMALLLTMHCGVLRAINAAVGWHSRRVVINLDVVFSDRPDPLSGEMAVHVDRAIRLLHWQSSIANGGIALLHDPTIDGPLALLHSARGEFDEAERSLRRLIRGRSDSIKARRYLGLVLAAQHRDDEVGPFYEATLSAHPDWTEIADYAVAWYREHEQFDKAVRVWRQFREQNPQSASALRNLALALLDADRGQEGAALLREYLERDPHHAWANFSMARILSDEGRDEEAHAALERALRREPQNAIYHRAMGRLLRMMQRPDEAERHFEEALRLEQ